MVKETRKLSSCFSTWYKKVALVNSSNDSGTVFVVVCFVVQVNSIVSKR
jgi:hypothetical protein